MTSETEKPNKKKIPYQYGMTDPSAYFVARVWQVVEEKAGFAEADAHQSRAEGGAGDAEAARTTPAPSGRDSEEVARGIDSRTNCGRRRPSRYLG